MEMSAESMRLGEGTIENPFTMFTTEDFDNAKNTGLEGINELQT
jgi:hypothetical protein